MIAKRKYAILSILIVVAFITKIVDLDMIHNLDLLTKKMVNIPSKLPKKLSVFISKKGTANMEKTASIFTKVNNKNKLNKEKKLKTLKLKRK